MKNIKTFENWKNNIIDDKLFTSGKAKYEPTVHAGVIKYKTGNSEPYYFARIQKKGMNFICKIFKKTDDGETIRLRNKRKKDLKSAHNYVREFLNQRLKRDEKRNIGKETNIEFEPKRQYEPEIEIEDDYSDGETRKFNNDTYSSPTSQKPRSRTIIRRF